MADALMLQPTFAINWVWAGPQEQGQVYSAPWIALEPLSYNETNYNWSEFPAATGNGIINAQCLKYGYKNSYSLSYNTYDIPTIRNVWNQWAEFVTVRLPPFVSSEMHQRARGSG